MKCQHCNSEEIKEVNGQLVCQFCGNEVKEVDNSIYDKLSSLGFTNYEEPWDPYTLGKSFKVKEGYIVIYFPLEDCDNKVVICLTDYDSIYNSKKILGLKDLDNYPEVKKYWINNLSDLIKEFSIKIYKGDEE